MLRVALSVAAAMTITASAAAHHSISAIYDSTRRATLEGTVSQFHLVTRTCPSRIRRQAATGSWTRSRQ
jgi:hypothetical protein